ncbi:MAG: DUF928 domain-containing protein [Geitlerinemataceae cyanobacterium]
MTSSGLPAVAGLAIDGTQLPYLAQFDPADRPPPLSASGGGARFSPPERNAPESAAGGATRNSCVSMSPLVPKDANGSYYGLTASGRPELYLYALRASGTRAEQATLFIYEYTEGGPSFEPAYEKAFDLPEATRSIVRVSIDEATEFELDPDSQYEWYIEIECEPGSADPTTLAFTYGWIERTSDDPVGLGTIGTNEAAAAYGDAGIWFEYLGNLVAAGPENWDYILSGFSDAIGDSVDLSGAQVVPSEDNSNVQIVEPVAAPSADDRATIAP